jgi:hypothetical protein
MVVRPASKKGRKNHLTGTEQDRKVRKGKELLSFFIKFDTNMPPLYQETQH